jgi:hypothetical protein
MGAKYLWMGWMDFKGKACAVLMLLSITSFQIQSQFSMWEMLALEMNVSRVSAVSLLKQSGQ